jgi:hypothetical protein
MLIALDPLWNIRKKFTNESKISNHLIAYTKNVIFLQLWKCTVKSHNMMFVGNRRKMEEKKLNQFSVRSMYLRLCQGIPRKHFGDIWRIAIPLNNLIFL